MGLCGWKPNYVVAVCSAVALLILKSSLLVMIALLLIEINFDIPTEILLSTSMMISLIGTVILILKTMFVFLILVGLSLGKLQLLRVFLWPASICFMLDCFLQLFSIIYILSYQPRQSYENYTPALDIIIAVGLLFLDGILSLLINIYYNDITKGKVDRSTAAGNEWGKTGFLIVVA